MVEKRVTPEEFAKKYRELFDMARRIEGMDSVNFKLTYRGNTESCQRVKILVEYEMAESMKMQLDGEKE